MGFFQKLRIFALLHGKERIAIANLGFEKNTVIIEALQGPENKLTEIQPEISRFEQSIMHWVNFLLKEIEKHAKPTVSNKQS